MLTGLWLASPAAAREPDAVISAVRGVIERILDKPAENIDLRVIPPQDGHDVLEIESRDGQVRIAGSSGVALARGFYEYLKRACGQQVTWDGGPVHVPQPWPDMPPLRIVCPVRYRHYFNVCTFGYTTVWWDWPRWEREIDWMALHGINMPLAMNGQESVWRDVWRELGLTGTEIASFFSGPAFLPWHGMGNLNGHAGPLPASWHTQQHELQRRILERERALGMTPVTPAFSGFVPPALRAHFPQAEVRRSTAWCGFEPTYLLSPRDPLFERIGRRFVEAYSREYGTDHLYLADVFNEMRPQVGEKTRYEDLAAMGEAVYRSIRAGDSDGVWVMQGWLLYNERDFWGPREVEAFLRSVPDDRMIIIDLAIDHMEVWRAHPAVRKKMWIGCVLHNFGQTTALFGNLRNYATVLSRALTAPERGQMVGLGLTPEGLEQNAVVYELATDAMWTDRLLDVDAWLPEFVKRRYGADVPQLQEGWRLLSEHVYSSLDNSVHYVHRPSLSDIGEPGPDLEPLRRIVELFLSAADRVGANPAYMHDLVDVEKRWLERCARLALYRAILAHEGDERPAFDQFGAAYLRMLGDIDRLLATRPEYRLSRWFDAARRFGTTDEEQALYKRNAMMQVTIWGGPMLHDYAWKEWSGLVSGFYAERWRQFFAALTAAVAGSQPFDEKALREQIADWETAWVERIAPSSLKEAEYRAADTLSVARVLLRDYGKLEGWQPDRGIAVSKPVTCSGGTEGAHLPKFAVDGLAGGDYWAASPYPQWLQIDLEQPEPIGAVRVFTYSDGTRYYQYTVELSLDGQQWTLVADLSDNTRPATARGLLHEFAPITARYVRVNMLKNSANIGVHLREVRVFRAQP